MTAALILKQVRKIIPKVFFSAMILVMTMSSVSTASGRGRVQQDDFATKQGYRSMERAEIANKVGSRPPKCEHKCGGCVPCYAIQVPSLIDGVRAQYTNYEPEGWKCKCGSFFQSLIDEGARFR